MTPHNLPGLEILLRNIQHIQNLLNDFIYVPPHIGNENVMFCPEGGAREKVKGFTKFTTNHLSYIFTYCFVEIWPEVVTMCSHC